MVFLFPQVTTIILFTFFVLLYCYVVGYPIAQKTTSKACFELSFLITIAMLAISSLLINNVFNVGIIQSAIIFIIPLFISCCVHKFNFQYLVQFRQNKCILILPIVMSCIVASGIFIKVNGNMVALSDPVFDHMKVAVIDSITRKGFPIENPFLISHSGDSVFHYYYLWYLLAANISIIFNISGLSADIILTFVSALISIFTSFFIITDICSKENRTKAQYIACLLLLSGSCVSVIDIITNHHLYDVLSRNHSLEFWLQQAVWVPQHLLSASFVVLSLYLLGIKGYCNKITLFVTTMLVVSAFGSSVWVGGITFFVTSIMMFIYDIVTSSQRKKTIYKWVLTAVFSLMVSIPILRNMLSAPKGSSGHAIGLSVYDTSVRGPISDFIFFFIGAMPLWNAAITIAFYIILIKFVFAKISFNKEYKVLIIICLGSLLTALFLQSQIANNDLGWRSIIPFLIAGSSIASIFFVSHFSESCRYLILIIASISLFDTFQYSRMMVYGNNYFEAEINVADFSKLSHITDKNDRILNNIHQNANNQPLDGNILSALLMNRSSCFQNMSYSFAFGPDWGDKLFRMNEAITRLYNGEEGQQDLDLIKQFKCNKIVVTKLDPIWNKDNTHLRKVYSDDRIKVFTVK